MSANKRTILVIDDEEKIRKVLSINLHKENYNVIQSSGGPGIFEDLHRLSYEMVVCDIRMPVVDGVQILKYIREKFDNIPVVILTGFHDMGTAINVLKMGAIDFLIKPILKDQLLKVVRNAFRIIDLTIKNKQLEQDNLNYQRSLEIRVEERTSELKEKTLALEGTNKVLQSMNLEMVKALAEAIEAKDKYTGGHCERMRIICLNIGDVYKISDKEKTDLEYAAILHDLGKIGISDTILNKPDRLNDVELSAVKEHPLIGERILSKVATLKDVSKVIKHHHENYDGTGYPDGLKCNNIPFLSRIIAVADVYDALTSNRPYRSAFSQENALVEMKKMAGTKLDDAIVELFKARKDLLQVDGNKNNGSKVKRETTKKSILVIDDEYLVRKTLTYHLQKAGFEILEADTGGKAISMIAEYNIDLVICDLKLPDIDGTELIKIIKSKSEFLPIVVSSGCLNKEIISNIKKNGVSHYIEKPYLKDRLLSVIHKMLPQPEEQPEGASSGSLLFDIT